MHNFSHRLNAITPSASMAMADIIRSLPNRDRVIDMSLGQPDFSPPLSVKENACKAIISDAYNGYSSSRGVVNLRESISKLYKKLYKAEYHPDEILVTPGVKQGIMYVMLTLLNPGDEVLLFEPCWLSYRDIILIAGGIPKFVPAKNDLSPDLNKFSEIINSKTKIILINNPVNPSGYLFKRNQLEYIATTAKKYGTYLVADEIYDRITFASFTSMSQIDVIRNQLIVANGFSKSYAMPGWRIGYLLGTSKIISKINLIHQHTATCAPTLSQHAAYHALESGEAFVEKMCKTYNERRDLLANGLKNSRFQMIKPMGTFYSMIDVSCLNVSPEKNSEQLLLDYQIASVNGLSYGQSSASFVRFSLTQPKDKLQKIINRLQS